MLKIDGKYNSAIVYADSLEKGAAGQLAALCDQPFVQGSRLRIMPDAHAGAGSVIGTTMTIAGKIVPNLVGVDIGCGMEVFNIGRPRLDFQKLDNIIRSSVPAAFAIREKPHRFSTDWDQDELKCGKILHPDKTRKSIGTLGGGNHFIELGRDEESGDFYLVIHSGSRNPGHQVAAHYQKIAGDARDAETPWELAWLSGADFDNYLHDMKIMQNFASLNRRAIADEIIRGMKWKALESFATVHNYLDVENMILRKGAVSAQAGERLLIPMNMRDGSLLCRGLGNADWNYSAPHGAGRLFSRKDAREKLTLTQFKKEMLGIYSSCISRKTIDESPGAYKPMQAILDQIADTAQVLSVIRPVYNFKAGGE